MCFFVGVFEVGGGYGIDMRIEVFDVGDVGV